jgi:hypothetical protein
VHRVGQDGEEEVPEAGLGGERRPVMHPQLNTE